MDSCNDETLMLRREVASHFRVTTRTVDRWVAAGILPAIRVRGITRFRRGDLDSISNPL